MANEKDQGIWDAPLKPFDPDHFELSASAKKSTGVIDTYPGSTPAKALEFFWMIQKHYDVYDETDPTAGAGGKGQKVGSFDVIVPYQQQIELQIWTVLFTHKNLPPAKRARIEEAFDDYTYTPGSEDKYSYIARRLSTDLTGVTVDDFSIEQSFSIKKKGIQTLRAHDEQESALLDFYQGKGTGTVWIPGKRPANPSPEEFNKERPSAYIKQRKFRAVNTSTRVLNRLPESPAENLHEQELKGRAPKTIIEDILNAETEKLECHTGLWTRHGRS